MNEKIIGQTFDQERVLYNLKDTQVVDCIFAGPADGESALKESRDVALKNCRFSLRYPLWHSKKFLMEDSSMDELTRAAIWYASDGTIKNSILGGIKCLRECDRMKLDAPSILRSLVGNAGILRSKTARLSQNISCWNVKMFRSII